MQPFVFSLLIIVLTYSLGWALSDPQRDTSAQPTGEQKILSEPSSGEERDIRMKPDYVPDELLVSFRDGTSEARIDAINQVLNVHVIRKIFFGQMRVCQIKIPEGQSLDTMKRAYLVFSEVETVEPNYKVRIQ